MDNDLLKFVNEHSHFYKNVHYDVIYPIVNSSCYLCFDTESCRDFNDRKKERVYAWSISNTDNDEMIFGTDIESFLELLQTMYFYRDNKLKKKKIYKRLGFIHNLQWDVEFFKYKLDELGYKYYSKLLFDDGTVKDEKLDCNCFNIVENNGVVYSFTIQIKIDKKHFAIYQFNDSLKLIPQSLDSIARNVIKIPEMFYKLKDDFNYKEVRGYDYIPKGIDLCYIYNDTYILKEFIKQYYIANDFKGYTASSIAFNNLLNYLYPDTDKKYELFEINYPKIQDEIAKEIIAKSYSGGFTYANPTLKGKTIIKNGHSIDINSSYPARMKYCKLPYGTPYYFTGKGKTTKKYDIFLQRIQFDGFKRKNNSHIGFIKAGNAKNFIDDFKEKGFRKNDYLATNIKDGKFICSNFEMVLTNSELDFLLQVYDFYTYRRKEGKILKGKQNLCKGIYYVDGLSFKSRIGDFGGFIDDAVMRKNKSKKLHNSIMKTVAKTDMNSVYGKLGTSYKRKIMEYRKNDRGIFEFVRKFDTTKEYDYEENRQYYRAYSSFVTSYGRQDLQKTICKIEELYGEDKFVYCDTDSIYCLLSVDEIKKLGIKLDGYELGAWDIEKEFYKIKTLGAKKYIVYAKDYTPTKCYKKENGKVKLIKDKEHLTARPHITCKCAGLPDSVRNEINFDNFYLGSKFTKKQKKKVIGGYRLERIDYSIKELLIYG